MNHGCSTPYMIWHNVEHNLHASRMNGNLREMLVIGHRSESARIDGIEIDRRVGRIDSGIAPSQ